MYKVISEAIILAGGLGTRLQSSVPSGTPKVLAEVKGVPFLTYLIRSLEVRSDVKRVVLSLGYAAEKVLAFLPELDTRLRIDYVIEESRLGTGGGAINCLPLLDSNDFFIVNGDSYSDLDLRDMARFHFEKGALLSMALYDTDESDRFGAVEIDHTYKVTAFREKQKNAGRVLVNTGVYAVNRTILETYPRGRNVSFEEELFPMYINNKMYGFPGVTKFIDIGTELSFLDAQCFEY